MVVKIQSGSSYVDITKYIAWGGLKWTLSDVEASDAGRTADAVMHRNRVAQKVRLDVTCRDLTTAEASTILQLIDPEYLTVRYTDPRQGGLVEKTMYSNNRPAVYARIDSDGTEWWSGINFPLIEA